MTKSSATCSTEPRETFTVTREDRTEYEVQVPPGIARRFRRQMKNLDALVRELREVAPQAGIYFNDGGPSLMLGPTHDARGSALHSNVWADGPFIPGSGGGDW